MGSVYDAAPDNDAYANIPDSAPGEQFLVGDFWNGPLAIRSIRIVGSLREAWRVADEMAREKYSHAFEPNVAPGRAQYVFQHWIKVYQVYPDKPMRRIKR